MTMPRWIRNWLNGFRTVDAAVALGLFGTGVGLALPVPIAEDEIFRTPANRLVNATPIGTH